MFWRITPRETEALLREIAKERTEDHRAANLRAGMIAATIVNVRPNRKRGSKTYKATDFIKEPTRIVSPEELERVFDGWASPQGDSDDWN